MITHLLRDSTRNEMWCGVKSARVRASARREEGTCPACVYAFESWRNSL